MRKENAVIYQIYPRAFLDTDGDGWGDLQGIMAKADYLSELGVDMVWISPIFPSPQKDNGYDVSDYKAIDPRFGSMEEFEQLVKVFRERGIGIMLDMVFNHTSTEAAWFQRAKEGDLSYRDYYLIRPAKTDGSYPTNWTSKFGGPAWAPFDSESYYLHLYDPGQADLNWRNPGLRQELYDVVNFWTEKGVMGFRFDVLNVIGKAEVLEDSSGTIEEEKKLYTDTPIVHDFIREMNRKSFGKNPEILTVGEMSSTNPEDGAKYSQENGKELSMLFQFHHLKVDYENGEKWTLARPDIEKLKRVMNFWQKELQEKGGWNALFWNNHDQPRANSRFADPVRYPFESATLLAQTIHLMRGTPYIYQGEEFGMKNPDFTKPEQFLDVEARNAYRALRKAGSSQEEAFEILKAKARDNSRTPMQWSGERNAGFSTGKPWMAPDPSYKTVNAKADLARGEKSIFRYYRKLIALRKKSDLIQTGSYLPILEELPGLFAYERENDRALLLQLSNFTDRPLSIPETALEEEVQARKFSPDKIRLLFGNYQRETWSREDLRLEPYEAVALLVEK